MPCSLSLEAAVGERVYIILVNYKGVDDTLECLESVFRLEHPNFRVVVVDNASGDGALERIPAWARGEVSAPVKAPAMAAWTQPSGPKPVSCEVLTREAAEAGRSVAESDPDLVVVDAGANLGFAGGNNVGIRHALARGKADFVWLLNNDTITTPKALSAMLQRCRQAPGEVSCGARILYYHHPDTVQALGGGPYNRWTGISWTTFGRGLDADESVDPAAIERRLDYIMGASWLLPRRFFEVVGLMREDYFLYCEEIDWCLRAKGRFALVYADDAIVYHKEGGSIGSPTAGRPSSLLSDFYIFRNKLRVVWRFFPIAYPLAYLTTVAQIVNRARRGQWDKVWLIARVLLGKRSYP